MSASDPSQIVSSVLAKCASREFPLTRSTTCAKADAAALRAFSPAALFPGSRMPEAALSGLLLRLGCWDESHQVSQDLESVEGSYWHGIAHRIEPDGSNASYWFRRVGAHPIFAELRDAAAKLLGNFPASGWRIPHQWDPHLFIRWCEEARTAPGSSKEEVALQIQRREWDLLYSWCLRPS